MVNGFFNCRGFVYLLTSQTDLIIEIKYDEHHQTCTAPQLLIGGLGSTISDLSLWLSIFKILAIFRPDSKSPLQYQDVYDKWKLIMLTKLIDTKIIKDNLKHIHIYIRIR